jgi:hypothetical protein
MTYKRVNSRKRKQYNSLGAIYLYLFEMSRQNQARGEGGVPPGERREGRGDRGKA